jgi:hypothetical protein
VAVAPDRRKRVAWLIDGHLADDFDEATFKARWEREFAAISSPEELFLYASESHPAQEPAEWRRLLDSPHCDQGTALVIFWRNSPVYYYGDEPAGGWSHDRERYELVREIAERCRTGGYPSAVVRFDPAAFQGFSFLDGHAPQDLERVPVHMRLPSSGDLVMPLAAPDFEWGAGLGGK